MIDPSVWDLTVAAALILAAGIVSLVLRLDLERRLAVASVRTIVQLLLVGYVLRWVFDLDRWTLVVAVIGVMVLVAAFAAVGRSSRTFTGATSRALVVLVASGLTTTLMVTQVVLGVEPWYRPQYLIPLLGMVLGNGLTGVSLVLDQVLERLATQRALIEMELSLGATRWEAARDHLAAAVRRGMIPVINTMMVVGVVSLPGMMTGQILAGSDPLVAVKYQIVVMFMIAASTSLGCMLMALAVYRRMFNARHQLDVDRIRPR
ncbi:MAG: iron export ABC transporter permease subunit FetB [Planctomycetota bacterium]|nr:MAG: iron export ABC transporter permease subunit FetB [Planctomycetota bacterium]